MENNSRELLHRFALFEFGQLYWAVQQIVQQILPQILQQILAHIVQQILQKAVQQIAQQIVQQLYNIVQHIVCVWSTVLCATIGKVKHEKLLGKLAADTDCKHHYQIHAF